MYIQAMRKQALEWIDSGVPNDKERAVRVLSATVFQFKKSFEEDCEELGESDCEEVAEEAGSEFLKSNICEGNDACAEAVEEYSDAEGEHANDPDNPYLVEDTNLDLEDIEVTVNTYRDLIDESDSEEDSD